MTNNDIFNRFERLCKNETKFAARQCVLAARAAKLRAKIAEQKKASAKYKTELKQKKECILKLEEEIAQLDSVRDDQLTRLSATKEHIELLKSDVKNRTEEMTTQLKYNGEWRCALRMLKEATNTFLKYSAMPERVQGVVLSKEEKSIEWHPFNIELAQYTQQEVQQQLRQQNETTGTHQDEWMQLIFGTATNNNVEIDDTNKMCTD